MLQGRQEDAYRHLQEAKQCLKQKVNYAKVLDEAQTCVELLTKDFLNTLGIPYKSTHDVSDEKISELLQKLKQPPFSTIVEAQHAFKIHLVWLMILLKSLTAIRSFLTYAEAPQQRLGLGAQEIFSYDDLERGKLLAKTIVDLTEETCEKINPILEEIKTKTTMLEEIKTLKEQKSRPKEK